MRAAQHIGSVSVMRSTYGSSFASAPIAAAFGLIERGLLGVQRRDVPVGPKPEQDKVELLEIAPSSSS